MKKYKVFLICISLLLVAAFCVSCTSEYNENSVANVASFEQMETNAYDVTMIVNENKTVEVTEKINVKFNVGKRGIIRSIPLVGDIIRGDENGNPQYTKEKMRISNVNVKNEKFTSYSENGIYYIKIGDSDVVINGDKSYELSYRLHLDQDKFDDYDEFYFNIFPSEWEGSIKSGSFYIKFPKPINDSAKFYYGADLADIDYSIGETSISGSLKSPLLRGYGLSVRLELENKYFKADLLGLIMAYLGIIIAVIAVIVCFALWMIYGRDEKPIASIEFEPPQGMTSADIGYILDGKVDDKDIISLLIYWADKGYLAIIEDEINKDDMTFKLLKDLPAGTDNYEKTLFYRLFETGTSVKLCNLEGKFYRHIGVAKQGLIDKYKDDTKRLYTKQSLLAKQIGIILSGFSVAFAMFLAVYAVLFNIIISAVVAIIAGIVMSATLNSIMSAIEDLHYGKRSAIKGLIGGAILIFIILFTLFFFSFINLDTLPICLISIGLSAVAMVFGNLSKKRTPYATEQVGKILGLKDFILKTEKSRIEELCLKDPEYFYSILPFAYVLGVSEVWSEKFEGLAVPPPTWYYGGNMSMFSTIILVNSLNRSMLYASRGLAVRPSNNSSGRGGSFGGGGFSGGGFSGGGGFGGGGGGSW